MTRACETGEIINPYQLFRLFHRLANNWRAFPQVPLCSTWGYNYSAAPQLNNETLPHLRRGDPVFALTGIFASGYFL
ncbi:MAG: hypothetical protein ABL999_06715 [Pyrinomonadaceae bacterium]